MKLFENPEKQLWEGICARPTMNSTDLNELVTTIMEEVQRNGDKALYAYSRKFDGVELNELQLSREEIMNASGAVSETLKQSIELARRNIERFLNTSHANVERFLEMEGEPYLEVHPKDAAIRNIADGDNVKAYNQRGSVYLKARISKKVTSGVVCMPHGFWSSLSKGGSSANALTNDLLTDMGRGGAIQEAKVEIAKV